MKVDSDKLYFLFHEISDVVEKYDKLFENNIDKVGYLIDLFLIDLNVIMGVPKFILTRAIYEKENSGIVEKVKFTIKPTIKNSLQSVDMKKSFVIVNMSCFFSDFAENLKNWFYEYYYYSVIEVNLGKLNSKIMEIIDGIDFPYDVIFKYGEGILDVSDNEIVLGLSSDVILNIEDSNLFIEDAFWREQYINKIINSFKECNRPFDIVKVKSDFTYEYGIYSRKNLIKMLRKTVNRKIDYVRTGVGYIDTDNLFAIIEKKAVREEQLKDYDLESVVVLDNTEASMKEKNKNQTKIVISYKLSPVDKKSFSLVEIGIKEILGVK